MPLKLAAKLVYMEFKLEYNTIIGIVEEEVSREAAQAYSTDGSSLYDGLRMVSRDEEKKKRLLFAISFVSSLWLCLKNNFIRID